MPVVQSGDAPTEGRHPAASSPEALSLETISRLVSEVFRSLGNMPGLIQWIGRHEGGKPHAPETGAF